MFNLDAITVENDFVGFGLEVYHRRQVCGNCVCRSYLSVNYPIKRQSEKLDGFEARKTILAV